MSRRVKGAQRLRAKAALESVLENFNGGADLAHAIGVSRQVVNRWMLRGYVSIPGALRITKIVRIARAELRPDVANWKRYE